MKFYLPIFLALLASVKSFTGWGSCQHPTLQQNFNVSNYAGVWYEAARSKSIKFETGDCVSATYTPNADGTLTVVNSQRVDDEYDSITGKAYCDSQKSGQCWVKFFKFQPWGDYEVVYTDYENVSVVYSCTSFLVAHEDAAWVLVRNPNTSAEKGLKYLKEIGFKDSDFVYTNQQDCPGREN